MSEPTPAETRPNWIGASPSDRPRLLVAAPSGDSAAALLSLVLEAGFRVLSVSSGRDAVDEAPNQQPDLILLDIALPDLPAAEACRALLAGHRVSTTTPVLFAYSSPPTTEQRLDLVRAGARDGVGPWIEPGAVRRLCDAYVEAKRTADLGATESLFDPATGLYSWQGLVRRAREVGALAIRQHQGLACIVFVLDLPRQTDPLRHSAAAVWSARRVQQAVRLSDAVGRPGDSEFAVLAPATDAEGAVGLATRLALPARAAAAEIGLDPDDVTIRAGYDAVPNLAYAPMDAATLLLRAGTALRSGEPEPQRRWLRRFVTRESGL